MEECAMANIAQLHRRALEETRPAVAGIDRAQWAGATPCDGWDVRALLNHLVSGNLWAAELGSGKTIEEVGNRLGGDVLGDNALASYMTPRPRRQRRPLRHRGLSTRSVQCPTDLSPARCTPAIVSLMS